MIVDDAKILIGETNKGRLYVYLDEWQSNRYIHIRYFYHNKQEDIWKPSKTGIGIPESMVTKIFAAVTKVLKYAKGEE